MHADIKVRPATQQDELVWDAYVKQHAHASPYHCFAWMRACEQAYQQPVAGLIAEAANSQGIVGVFPLVSFAVPVKGKQLVSLPYCDLGYPLADAQDIETALLQAAQHHCRHHGYRSIDVRRRAFNAESLDNPGLDGQKVSMRLPLPNGSEALMAGFKSKLRSQIRKAEKNGLTLTQGRCGQCVDAFYQVYATNMRDLGSPAHAKGWFEAVMHHYGQRALIGIVWQEQTPIGGGLILTCGSHACIPWASTLRDYNHLAPNMLLYWSLLSYCADNGIHEFDFGRSSYGEGTFNFKKQWGALPFPLQWQTWLANGQRVEDPPALASSGGLREKIEALWSRLPVSVTTAIGSRVRGYISL